MIVVDTNVVVHLLAGRGEMAELAAKLLRRDPEWGAPPILLSELRNVLAGWVRRGVAEAADAHSAYDDAALILAGRIVAVDGSAVIREALELGLSAYDAEFVVLARSLGVRLVSEDSAILESAPEVAESLAEAV